MNAKEASLENAQLSRKEKLRVKKGDRGPRRRLSRLRLAGQERADDCWLEVSKTQRARLSVEINPHSPITNGVIPPPLPSQRLSSLGLCLFSGTHFAAHIESM